jgi:hypothetical protein
VKKTGLWYRVLVARYGEEAGRVRSGGRKASTWWMVIARIQDGEERGWFSEGVERWVGNGDETLFWTDPWRGGVSLSIRYRRLFDLSLNRAGTVAFMCLLGWEEGGAAWSWHRRMWAWEEVMLGECRSLLSNIVLQPIVADKWMWRHDPGGGYTVRSTYSQLTFRDVQEEKAISALIWHKQVLVKVSVLAWRLLRNRLPTKDNLVRRHIVTHDSRFCVTGFCTHVELDKNLGRLFLGLSVTDLRPFCPVHTFGRWF